MQVVKSPATGTPWYNRPCPQWCRLAGSLLHEWEPEVGADAFHRWHDGPKFGAHVTVSGREHEDGLIELCVDVEAELYTQGELAQLATDLEAARRWVAEPS